MAKSPTEALERALEEWREWARPDNDVIESTASYTVEKFVELLVKILKGELDG